VAEYTVANLKTDVEDQAPNFGMSPDMEARFARQTLELQSSGVSYQKVTANFRVPFGHTHSKQEEVYVIVSGGGRMKLEDEIVEVKQWDAVRVAAGTWRGFEAGPEGAELLAYGARCGMASDENDVDMEPGWWSD
jgi:mannose-6-phosphate isomerase-like protein (cupin superfamily)